jgi:hypothetical protein
MKVGDTSKRERGDGMADLKLAVTDLDDADPDACVVCDDDADDVLSVAFGMDGYDFGICDKCAGTVTAGALFAALRKAAGY